MEAAEASFKRQIQLLNDEIHQINQRYCPTLAHHDAVSCMHVQERA